MKKLQDSIKSLDLLFLDFRSFISALVKKWLLWIFLVFDLVAIVIQYIYPEYKLPQGYYVGFAVLGFVWSSFLVYRDLLTDYKKSNPEKLKRASNLNVSFVEGNEYKFSLDDPYGDEIEAIERAAKYNNADFRIDEKGFVFVNDELLYTMPEGNLEINFRIENTGDFPIDILDMSVSEEASNYTLTRAVRLSLQRLTMETKPIRFPLYIDTKEVIVISSRERVIIGLGANHAKFAAEFRNLPKTFQVKARVETLGEDGKKKIYETSLNISWRPLIDLYITQWRHFSQTDYLRLSGFD